jgi:CHAD domain-containing protein
MDRSTSSELLVRQRLLALTKSLPAARSGDAAALHEARVASRRMRAALPVVAPGSRARKLERQVRRITRALGPVRELDVALQLLDEFEGRGEIPRHALARLRQVVDRERQALHQDMERRLERCNLDKMCKRTLAMARKQTAPVRGARGKTRDPRRVATAERRAGNHAQRLRVAMENAAGLYLPDRLHEVRIALKKLRYSTELVRELRGSRATGRIRTLKKVQDLLGRMHDFEVLIARTRGVQGSPGASSLRLSADLDRLVRKLETECRRLHGRYMTSRRALLTICEDTIAASPAASEAPAA